jgi:hypothetical protein
MKNILMAVVLLSAFAGTSMAETDAAVSPDVKVAAAETTKAEKTETPDGKRLPGRDCKLYQGGTRQHLYPQYELGNVNRPECLPETK